MFFRKETLSYWFFVVFVIPNGCTSSKGPYYSYKVKTYSVDSVKKLVSVANLISYGDYLFEFNTQINISDSISGGEIGIKRGITYSSDGSIYLMKKNSKFYFELENFSVDAKINQKGKNSEKPFGMQFNGYDTSLSSNPLIFKTAPIDTIINKVECYYIDINLAVNNVDSSYEQKIFLYKDKFFNSFYKLWNANYLDSNYCIIGLYFFDRNHNYGYVEEPESLRALTTKEEKICEGIIKRIAF